MTNSETMKHGPRAWLRKIIHWMICSKADAAKTAIILAVSILLTELIRPISTGNQNLIMIYILAVLIISRITTGYRYGVAAALVTVLVYDYLITPPRMGFSFTVGFPITLIIMLVVTLVTCTLTMDLKTHALVSEEREHRAKMLYEMNQELLTAREYDAIIQLANEYIAHHMHRSVIFYAREPGEGAETWCVTVPGDADEAFFSKEETRLYARRAYTRRVLIPGAPGGVHYFPVAAKSGVQGVLGVSCKNEALSKNQITVLSLLTAQVALALELQQVSDQRHRVELEAEGEKMRSSLLSSISHDLRTPLTSILGASSALQEQGRQMDEATRVRLATGIRDDAQWLIRVVENLLTITRVGGEVVRLKTTPEAVEEIVADALSVIRKRFPERVFQVKVPDRLLLVDMDAILISQVLMNLLENAVKNSPPDTPVFVQVREEPHKAVFEVLDNGTGIPEEMMGSLFSKGFADGRRSADTTRGMGIGLSLCKTIIQVHGGEITGKNREDGGAQFSFTLPLVQHPPQEAAEHYSYGRNS